VKKILLISFKYPPYSGVGAFRWANLSYQFAELGYKVYVITTKWNIKENSSFLEVLNHPNIVIHKLPSLGFNNLRYEHLKNRVLNRLRKYLLKVTKNLFYIDDAQQWHWIMIPFVKRLIKKENIKTIIATGAPFTVNYAAAKIKNSMKNVKLIQDFRDPWNDDILYTPQFGNRQRLKKSEEMELFALNKADKVVSVTKMLSKYFEKKSKNPVFTVYNGFSSKNLGWEKEKEKSEKIKIIYAGNINAGRAEPFKYFLEKIAEFDNIVIDLYCSGCSKIEKVFSEFIEKKVLNTFEKISYEKLMEIIPEYNYGLHVNAKEYPDALSTKIYDYLSAGIPLVSVNYGGEIEELINANNFGYSINIADKNTDMILKLIKMDSIELDPDKVGEFSYEKIIKKYVQIIEHE